jgi:hypothetical protein
VAFGAAKPRPEKENIASWECRFEMSQGGAPRMDARTSKLHSDRCGKVPEAMSLLRHVAFEFFKCKSRKQESETYDCGRNKNPGVLETSASDSGIMRKIQEQESSRARLWWPDSGIMRKIKEQESSRWPDSGMMQMIQTQESTLLA